MCFMEKETSPKVHTLHRYFLWTCRMKNEFQTQVRNSENPPIDPTDINFRLWFSSVFLPFCHWFASLFVVVEGYEELCQKDPCLKDLRINALLSDTVHRDLLRRFRNGVYHYQSNYFDDRLREFTKEKPAEWASDLHDAFSAFFIRQYNENGLSVDVTKSPEGDCIIRIETPDGTPEHYESSEQE